MKMATNLHLDDPNIEMLLELCGENAILELLSPTIDNNPLSY